MRRLLLVLAAALAATTVLAGCGSDDEPAASAASGNAAAAGGDITVFAAASLTGSFTEIGAAFEAAHPGSTVTFSFGASSALAQQIQSGAPADVFASASKKNMDQVVAAKAADAPRDFARNQMQIAVPPDNPAGITGLADLAKPGVKVALCAAEVPCGTVARQVSTKAKVNVTPVTNEADVKATLTKVQLGEVDAGVVYVTDVLAAGPKVKGIEIPADVNASTSYPIAKLTESRNPTLAHEFVTFALSPEAEAILTKAGFAKP